MPTRPELHPILPTSHPPHPASESTCLWQAGDGVDEKVATRHTVGDPDEQSAHADGGVASAGGCGRRANRLLLPRRLPALLPGQTSGWLRLQPAHHLRRPCFVTLLAEAPRGVVQPTPTAPLVLTPPPRALAVGDRVQARVGSQWRNVKVLHIDLQLGVATARLEGRGELRCEIPLERIRAPWLPYVGATGADATRPATPKAWFKLTALRPCGEAVRLRFVLSGPGAAELEPPPTVAVRVRAELYSVTVPREVLDAHLDARQPQTRQHLHVLLLLQQARANSAESSRVPPRQAGGLDRACAAVVRELAPRDVAIVRCDASLSPNVSGFALPEAALIALQQPGVVGARGGGGRTSTRGLLGGVEAAVSLALERLESAREEQLLRADGISGAEMYATPVCRWAPGQAVEQFARRCVLDIVEHAAELGEVGPVRRQARREKSASRYARELRRDEDHLFLLVMATDGGPSRAAPAAAAPAAAAPAASSAELIRSLGLSIQGADAKLAVRILLAGSAGGEGPEGSEPTQSLGIKAALQTEVAWEPKPLYFSPSPKQLAAVVRSLCADALQTILSPSLCLELPERCKLLHCGFVAQLGEPPRWRLPLRLGSRSQVTVLFQGPPPAVLLAQVP